MGSMMGRLVLHEELAGRKSFISKVTFYGVNGGLWQSGKGVLGRESNTGKGRRCDPAWREEVEPSDFLDESPWWFQRWPTLQSY